MSARDQKIAGTMNPKLQDWYAQTSAGRNEASPNWDKPTWGDTTPVLPPRADSHESYVVGPYGSEMPEGTYKRGAK